MNLLCHRVFRSAWVLLLVLGVQGCRTTDSGPYQPPGEERRETARADELNREAQAVWTSDPEAAERLLREALTADLFHGASHNNLGLLHYQAGRLYEAAHEFEWARQLLPGNPDPRVHLGLVLARAGRSTDAVQAFEDALEVTPEHLPAIKGLALELAKHNRQDARLLGLFDTLAMRAEEANWRTWALEQRARLLQ